MQDNETDLVSKYAFHISGTRLDSSPRDSKLCKGLYKKKYLLSEFMHHELKRLRPTR